MNETKDKKTYISIPEARVLLEKIDAEKSDQIQKRTLDYAIRFSKTTADKAREIGRRLQGECGLTEREAVEVVNILPQSMEELRVFTAGWKKLLPGEVLDKILKIIADNI